MAGSSPNLDSGATAIVYLVVFLSHCRLNIIYIVLQLYFLNDFSAKIRRIISPYFVLCAHADYIRIYRFGDRCMLWCVLLTHGAKSAARSKKAITYVHKSAVTLFVNC